MIITNNSILIKDKESGEFKTFTMPALIETPNIPFYHQFAEKIAECQYVFYYTCSFKSIKFQILTKI